MTGFIAMQRDALEHPLLKDGERFRAWFWLVANAAWKPTTVTVAGKRVALDRGQLSYSQRYLAEAWGWSKGSVGRFIKDLAVEGMISPLGADSGADVGADVGAVAPRSQAILVICNYAKYQDLRAPSNDEAGADDRPEDGADSGANKNQFNHITISNDMDDKSSLSAIDVKKAIFDTGRMILKDSGRTDREAGSIIGRWRKQYSDSSVLTALSRCQVEQPSEPVEWITKALQSEQRHASGQSNFNKSTATAADRARAILNGRA